MQCSSCGYEHVFPVRELPSRYSRCPKCGTYAYIVRKEETTNHYINPLNASIATMKIGRRDRKKVRRDIATAAAVGGIFRRIIG